MEMQIVFIFIVVDATRSGRYDAPLINGGRIRTTTPRSGDESAMDWLHGGVAIRADDFGLEKAYEPDVTSSKAIPHPYR